MTQTTGGEVEPSMSVIVPATSGATDVVPRFEISVDENKKRIALVQQFVKEQMKEGEDYGVIPGVEKPSLLKPGAEKLCNIFGFGVEIDEVRQMEDWDRGIFHYVYKAIIRNKRTNLVESECIGSCNNKESKYAYRWIPDFKATETEKSRSDRQETRKARSGKDFVWYRVPNDDPFSQVNTIQKMAQKRAVVGAVLIATRASGFLTQDVEDMGDLGGDPDQQPIPRTQNAPNNNRSYPSTNIARDPNEPASKAQHGYIKGLIKKLGHDEEWFENWSKKPIEKLTKTEAHDFIERLKKGEDPELPTVQVDEELGGGGDIDNLQV